MRRAVITLVTFWALLLCPGASAAPPLGATLVSVPSERDIELLRESGLRSARFVLSWDEVEARHGEGFDWTQPDLWFSGLARAGVRPLPMLYGSGPFGEAPAPPLGSRPRRGWRRFVAAAVERYGSEGEFWAGLPAAGSPGGPLPPRAWQVWNEQNAVAFWPPRPSPTQYARVLAVAALEIREADPEATVLLGGMPGSPQRPASLEAAAFLRKLYRRGAARDFDAVAIHPYAANLSGVRAQYGAIRREMKAAGDGRAATWVTEFGWASVPAEAPGRAGLTRNPKGQATALRKAVNLFRAKRQDWNIHSALWFSWRDPGIEICAFCASLGLLELDHTRKPSYRALRRLTGGH